MSNFINQILGGRGSFQAGREATTGESVFDEAGSMLGDLVKVSPLAVGVAVGVNRLMSNQAVSLTGDPTSPFVGTADKVGDNIRRAQDIMNTQRQRNADSFVEGVLREGNLENNIRESGDKRKSFLAALLSHLDDNTDIETLRLEIMSAIDQTDDLTNDQISKIRDSVRTVIDTSPEGRSSFNASVDRFGKVASQIVSPTGSIKGLGPNFNPISTPNLQTEAGRGRHARLLSALPGAEISYREIQEFGGDAGRSTYARIKSGGREWSVALELAKLNPFSGDTGSLGAPIYRVGETQGTTRLGRGVYIDAPAFTANYLQGGGKASGQAIINQINRGGNTVFHGLEEYNLRLVEQMARRGRGGNLSASDIRYINEMMAQAGTQFDRAARPGGAATVGAGLNAHLQHSAYMESSYGMFTGVEKLHPRQQQELVAQAITMESSPFGGVSGGKADITRVDQVGYDSRSFAQVAITGDNVLVGNSPMNLVRNFGKVDSFILPLTARPSQLTGRPERFVTQYGTRVESTLGKGASVRMFGQDLGFTSYMTDQGHRYGSEGGINSIVLMDLDGGHHKMGLGDGMSYWGMKPQVETHITKSVMDPNSVNSQSAAMLEMLKERKRNGAIGPYQVRGAKAIAEHKKKYGGLIGWMDNTEIRLGDYSDLQGFDIDMVEDIHDSMGRTKHALSGRMWRGGSGPVDKGFGYLGKVTTRTLTESIWHSIVGSGGRMGQRWGSGNGLARTLDHMGITHSQTMINAGDMLSKAPHYLASQMLTSLGLHEGASSGTLWGGRGFDAMMSEIGGEIGQDLDNMGYSTWNKSKAQKEYLGQIVTYAANQLESLGDTGTSQYGLTFGGVFKMAEQGKFGLTPEDAAEDGFLMRKIKAGHTGHNSYGDEIGIWSDYGWKEIHSASRRHQAIGVSTFSAGTPASTQRAAMASMEPRTYQWLHHRLRSMLGYGDDTVTDFMTAFMARKVGIGDDLTALKGIVKSVESMGGLGAGSTAGLATVSMEEFVTGTGARDTGMQEFLGKHKQGFMLSLDERAAKAMGVRPGGSIYMPGGDVAAAMPGTTIVRGTEDLVIEGELTRRMSDFRDNLGTLMQNKDRVSNELAQAQDQVGRFKSDMADLFGKTWRSSMAGKMTGSVFAQGEMINFGTGRTRIGDTFTLGYGNNIKAMSSVFNQRSGEAIFSDAQAFLDSMRTYMGSAKNEMIAMEGASPKDASKRGAREAGNIIQSFFLGMEHRHSKNAQKVLGLEGAARYGGASTLLGRHPQGGPGHQSPASVFRSDFGEFDTVFERYTATDVGKRKLDMLARQHKIKPEDITSFHDISKLIQGREKNRRQVAARLGFFRGMGQHIDEYMGQGGGRVSIPDLIAKISYHDGTKPLPLNLSRAAMMVGDADGDFYQLMMFSDKRHKLFKGDAAKKASWHADLAFAAQQGILFEESKRGVNRLGGLQMGGKELSLLADTYQEQMKEMLAKKIGPLNVAMDQLRFGIVHSVGDSPQERRAAILTLGFLMSAQETQIKGKKNKVAAKFADLLTTAIHAGVQSGGEDVSMLNNLFEHSIFRGSGIWDEGGLKFSVDSLEGIDENVRREINVALEASQGIKGREMLGVIKKAMGTVKEHGFDKVSSIMRASGMAGITDTMDNHSAWVANVHDAHSAQAAMLRGELDAVDHYSSVASNVKRRVGTAGDMVMKKFMGPLALGAIGAVGLGAALGDRGYRPTPMIGPGEISDHRVNAAIASGNMYNDHDPVPPPPVSDRMNVLDRPNHTQSAYFSKGNPYQIRGRVANMGAMNDVSSWVNSLGGSSGVRINDTRMPITPNYIDRIMGD